MERKSASGQYIEKIKKFTLRLRELEYSEYVLMEAEYRKSSEPVLFKDRLNGKYVKVSEGDVWGESWDSAWFHLSGVVPVGWKGGTVSAVMDFNGEAMVFSGDGVPLQGLTSGSIFHANFERESYVLNECCTGGEKVNLWVEASASNLFGLEKEQDPESDSPKKYGHYEGKANKMRLCLREPEIFALRCDMEVLLSLAESVNVDSVRKAKIIECLNRAVNEFRSDPGNSSVCRKILGSELKKKASASSLNVTAVGHAHIDTGWLWPVRESIRKCARTFSSQIALLEKYPDYVFGASQAQHFEFIMKHYPELYRRVKKYVAGGRFEIQGGMWVEADCNIISGESMVRQFLYGKNFFMDEFGVDVNNLWLPDVFGYSATMPQIIKKSGCDFFVTQKISWSQFNEFPYNTFKWRGIDGSEIIAHFPPENNYNSTLTPAELNRGRDNFSEKAILEDFLSLFGIGDGGGGPKEEFIENGLRQKDLEGSPKVRFGTARSFLDKLRKRESELPLWVGELYLELHRGTLTTQAKVKRYNRKLERLLRQVEFIYSCLPIERYPAEKIDSVWKMLLLNQFHDIIPGSSITMVYERAHMEYENGIMECQKLISAASDTLFEDDKDSLVIFNSISYPFTGVVILPETCSGLTLTDSKGAEAPVQNENGSRVVMVKGLPPNSFTSFRKSRVGTVPGKSCKNPLILENSMVLYEFDKAGRLLKAFDRECSRNLTVSGGTGNLLCLYEDRPNNWDAWDIDFFYEEQLLEHASGAGYSRIADGPVRQGIEFRLLIGCSEIKQRVYLEEGSKRLDFRTSVSWREKHRMLRVSFPVNLRSENASFDIQYGYVKRNTHRNTSWDIAKFETAVHRYADISENDYGVALLNDCKYGCKVYDNVLDLNLLRSPSYPDPDADTGEHEFLYSFLPHQGALVNSNVMCEAEKINQRPVIFDSKRGEGIPVPVEISGHGVCLEALKKARNDNSTVVRLVETKGGYSKCNMKINGFHACSETNLVEWEDTPPVAVPREGKELEFSPFEIKTMKLLRKKI